MNLNDLTTAFVFELLQARSSQYYNHLINILESDDVEQITVFCYPKVFKVTSISDCSRDQKIIHDLFYNLFSQTTIEVNYKVSQVSSIRLRLAKVDFRISTSGKYQLYSKKAVTLNLVLQLLCYMTEYTPQLVSVEKLKPSLTAVYLNKYLGESYSQGALVDFIDRLYDQYKQIYLSPKVFHKMFNAFGYYTIDIGNRAFDIFMESRDSRKSWMNSISGFLIDKLNFNPNLALKISELLLLN